MKKRNKGMRAIGVIEVGVASRLTRGVSLFLPWYELGVPPYIYWYPYS
jgi:hypothetical protein